MKQIQYAFKIQNTSLTESIECTLFNTESRFDENFNTHPNLILTSANNQCSYNKIMEHVVKQDVKISKICCYSDNVVQKRLPIISKNRDTNGQSCNVPMFVNENEELVVNLKAKTDRLQIDVLPNSIIVFYAYEEYNENPLHSEVKELNYTKS